MMLGLLASLGCANGRLGRPVTTTVQCPPPAGGSASSELTPSQAAQLCLTTAEALEKKGYAAEAIRQYENARKHDPQMRSVSRRLAVLYDLQGDPRQAEAEYLRAQQEQPGDAELLNDLGYFHYRHDHLSTAETWLQNAIAVDPNCHRAWINLGQVLAKQGRPEESYQAFARVLRPAEAYSNLGVLLAKQGRATEARTALQHALQLDPTLKQPQAFLNVLANAPSPLPPGITHVPPAPSIEPRAPAPPAVVMTPPPPPARPRTLPPPSFPNHPPTPTRINTAPPPRAVAQTPASPPVVAQAPADPLPIIRTVRQPSVAPSVPPPASSIRYSPTMPNIIHNTQTLSPAAPLTAPAPQPAKPFVLRVSPPPIVPKPEVRHPEVIITDCQGEPDNTP